jgi:uncharacterized Zn finger protein
MSWAARWRSVLGGSDPDMQRRVRQGVATYRSGRVSDVRLEIGRVSARVQGSRATPFLVELGVPTLTVADWEVVLDEAAEQGVRLFPGLDQISVAAGHSGEDPFPVAGAAVWEAVAVRLDTSPFPLLQLRGRGKDRILRDIARRRRDDRDNSDGGIDIAEISTVGWSLPSTPLDGVSIPRVTAPRMSVPALRVLGEPDGWAGALSPADLFGSMVSDAARQAADLLQQT